MRKVCRWQLVLTLRCPSGGLGWSHVDLQRDVITGNFDMESQ